MQKIKFLLLLLLIVATRHTTTSQTNTYRQLANEIQFTRTINDNWTTEVNVEGTFSETPEESRILQTNIQRAARIWTHYHYSPRWKFSSYLGYYYNKDVPDIGQYKASEWRFALQGIYYINKVGYMLNTRMQTEFRSLENIDGDFENNYRYRQMLKYMQPLNSKVLREGVVYLLASEELLFRSKTKTTGLSHFDRNRATVGAGYIFTDDLQLELVYINEYLPRDNGNELYHVLSFTFTINNFLPKIRKHFSDKMNTQLSDE